MRSLLIIVFSFLSSVSLALEQQDEWDKKLRALYEHLINTPTVAGRGNVPQLANYLAKMFMDAGFPQSDVNVMPYNDTAALIVRWRTGKTDKKPIMAMAHLDVVEAKREDWTVDPFHLLEKDGYFYGRGTIDIKQGVAVTAMAVLKLKSSGFKPNRDIILFYTGDEETAQLGAQKGASEWRPLLDVEYGLNSDAGGGAFTKDGKCLGFAFQTSEKIYADFTFTVKNKGGHSSKPRKDNAIYQLAQALNRLQAYPFKSELNETTRAYFEERQKSEKGALGDAMRAFLKNPGDEKAADTIETEEGETGYTRTTCVATRLEGGHANNALPQLAKATVNCRIMPGVDPEAIHKELERVVNDPEVIVSLIQGGDQSPLSPLRKDVLDAYADAVHVRFPDAPIMPEMSPGASDGLFFRAAGIPVYGVDGSWVISPDDFRAHGRDERLPVKALYDDLRHWERLLKTLTAPSAKLGAVACGSCIA